ncbi:hypothetical protein H4V97_002834 [Flavobacterium sp. CG_23.5]|uniref:hypothetical protein n=1 Tax=unclassified Flavobacterium TaxID=196869 RepID=UPI0018C9206A|nr:MULTISPECIES: hypothetical protein [unclassified Flavobacterium]MBG6109479.1 hypothetical protein [Flavobacterium sp. CG_9.10]MBP2284516.1 hypothetical protein [Flavobacterium sp. CG_23.5]
MTTLQNIIIILTITTLCSCNNSSTNKTETNQNGSIVNDTTNISNQPNNSTIIAKDDEEADTITTIKFNELSISINRLIIYDEERKIDQIQKDTVEIYAELGETIEGQLISISSDQLTNLVIEQRYETSVTIMNEGPHCDLTDWKHFYSDWKQLQVNNTGQFTCDKYSEKENEKFPKISIDDLKQKVKEQCGDEWLKLVEKVKTPTEYPSGVGISRYHLRVTGKRKDNGQTVTKLIVIETPMGC